MPIEYDARPGSANRGRRKRGESAARSQTEAQAQSEPQAGEVLLRVRMLRPVRSRLGEFAEGQTARLPADVARSWIGFGLAELDKSLDGPPEVK